MRDKTVKDAMTPLESVFMIKSNDTLGNVTMDKVCVCLIIVGVVQVIITVINRLI